MMLAPRLCDHSPFGDEQSSRSHIEFPRWATIGTRDQTSLGGTVPAQTEATRVPVTCVFVR